MRLHSPTAYLVNFYVFFQLLMGFLSEIEDAGICLFRYHLTKCRGPIQRQFV